MQGYNAQAVANEHQIVIAAEVMTGPRLRALAPMLECALAELDTAGVDRAPAVAVADAGFWHQEQIDRHRRAALPVLIPPDASSRKGPRPGWYGGRFACMRTVLATTAAASSTATQAIVEPIFGHTKYNRGIDASNAEADPRFAPSGD